MVKSITAFVLEAIAHIAKRFRNNDEAERQSALIASTGGSTDEASNCPTGLIGLHDKTCSATAAHRDRCQC